MVHRAYGSIKGEWSAPLRNQNLFFQIAWIKYFPNRQSCHSQSSRLLRITSLTRPAFVQPPVAIPHPFQLRRILTKVPLYGISVHIYRLRLQVLGLFPLLNPFDKLL